MGEPGASATGGSCDLFRRLRFRLVISYALRCSRFRLVIQQLPIVRCPLSCQKPVGGRRRRMRMLVGGGWKDKPKKIPVHNPYDNSVIDEVPRADAADMELALATAVRGAAVMRQMPAYDRYQKLRKAA